MAVPNSDLIMAVKDALRRFQATGVEPFSTSDVVAAIIATGIWDAEDVSWAEVDRVIRLFHYGRGVHKATFSHQDSLWTFGRGGPARSRRV